MTPGSFDEATCKHLVSDSRMRVLEAQGRKHAENPTMSNITNQTNNPNKLAIRPVRMKVFPTANTLNEAVEIMQASVPEAIWNEVYRNLMMYHNTLLKVLEDESLEKPETNDH